MKIEEYNNKIIINTEGRCDCGKYRGLDKRGIICDRCGIEVKHSKRIYFDKIDFFKSLEERQVIIYTSKP